jgi:hypothetical protein
VRSATEPKTDFSARDKRLIAAFLLGPVAWMLHLNVSYGLVPESCGRGTKLALHVVTIACVAIALIAFAMAWKIRGEAPLDEKTMWMSTVAAALAIAMAVVIVAQEIPNVILRSCL